MMAGWEVDHLWIFTQDDELVEVLGIGPGVCPFFDGVMTETINGVDTLEFSIPGDHPKASQVIRGHVAVIERIDGGYRAFKIQTQWQGMGEEGIRYRRFYCEDIAVDELNVAPVIERRPTSPTDALEKALEHSIWEVGQVDSGFPSGSTSFYHESAMSCIQKIVETWGGEVQFRVTHDGVRITGRYVDLLRQRGDDNGRRIVAGKDVRSMEEESDLTGLATALYGYGRGEEMEDTGGFGRRISFADVEWSVANGDPVDKPLGQEWVGDPEALAAWGLRGGTVHRFDFVIFEDEEDPEELLRKTWEELQVRKAPRNTLNVSIYDLEASEGYEHEAVRIGDIVTVINDDMSPPLEYWARIIEIKRHLNEPEKTELTIGQEQPTMTDTLNRINRDLNDVVRIGDPLNYLNTIFQTLTDDLNRTLGYVYISAHDGILVTDKPKDQNPTSAIRIKGGMIAIASEWDAAANDFKWRAFGTGEGFTADMMIAGTMLADRIRGGDLYLGGVVGGIGKDGRLFLVDSNDEVVAQLDAETRGFDELVIGNLISDSVVGVLNEDVDYYIDVVNGDDENNDGLSPSSPFLTMSRVIDELPKMLNAYCRIHIMDTAPEWNEYLFINSFMGWGNLEIYFPSSGNMTMNGGVLIEDCHTRIKIFDAQINYRDTEQRGVIWALNSSMVELYRSKLFGGNEADYNVFALNSYVELNECELWGAIDACVNSAKGSRVDVNRVKGESKYGLWASRSGTIGGHGDGLEAPRGTTANTRSTGGGRVWEGFDFSWSGGSTPPPPKTEIKTKTWKQTSVGSHEPTHGWRTDYVYQGDPGSWSPSRGNYRGLWFFNSSDIRSILSGKTIKKVRIKLTRRVSGGYYSSRPVYFWTHNNTSASGGAPTLSNSAGNLASFSPGETKWVNLPVAFGNALRDGTARGIAIYTSNTSQQNYLIMEKSATLEITYE